MIRINGFLAILLLLNSSCTDYDTELIQVANHEYEKIDLVMNDSTFFMEKGNDHYSDNYIYDNCNEIIYEYNYKKNGQIKYFDILDFRKWRFVNNDSLLNGIGTKRIKLSSLNPNPKYSYSPQSTIQYEYLNINNKIDFSSHTGIVENYKNILIHNPRGGFFWNLFPFPWPSIQFPIEINKKWNWQWSYNGDSFGDDRFTNWDDIIKMKFEYQVIGKEIIEFDFGKVECYKLEAVGKHGEIINKLEYYFNPKIGFVKFIFHCNDGAIINLYAVDYKDKCKDKK